MADRKAFLQLARKRFKLVADAENKQRQRELDDIRFYDGDQWPEDIKRIRQGQTLNQNSPPVPARPTLTIPIVQEPVKQVLNQERQSEMGITLVPADDFTGDTPPISADEIKVREGLVRRIQRDSEATDARTWAFSRATIAGRGYYGVMTRYVQGKSFDQEVFIQRFYNQACVSLDPAHEQPDGSDAEWGFIGTDMPWAEYVAQFGKRNGKKNTLVDCDDKHWRQLGDQEPEWFKGTERDTRTIRVVDYYYTEHTSRDLALLSNGETAWLDELPQGPRVRGEKGQWQKGEPITPQGTTIVQTRRIDDKRICWAKIDGSDDDVLEETEWPGKWIPIVKVLGEELQPYDKERRVQGMIRPAVDSQRAYNYMVSKWVEQIGLAPIPPWIMAAGQDEGFEAEWQASNTRTLPTLHYNPLSLNGEPVGPPTRTSITMDIQAIAASVQLFKESVANVTATPDTSLGHVDPTVKSGKLARLLIDRGLMGTSNYMDNLARSMRHEARIVNDLLYPIYGTRPGRIARLMNGQGDSETVLLGQPFVTQQNGRLQPLPMTPGQALPPNAQHYQLTPEADWNIAIKISKNYDTRREQEAAMLAELISADPQLMGVLGDLFFKYQDNPGHEEMAERMKAMLAPPAKAVADGKMGPDPQLQQAQMMIQQLQHALQSKVAEKQAEVQAQGQIDLAKVQLQNQAKLQEQQMENESKERLAWISASAQIAIAGAKIDAENARTFVDALEQRGGKALDLHMAQLQRVHDAQQGTLDRAHDVGLEAMAHAHALEQGQQAAALAPAPAEDATGTP